METHLTPAEWLEQVGQKAAAHDLMQEYGDYRARTAYNQGVTEALELAVEGVDKSSILNLKDELIKE